VHHSKGADISACVPNKKCGLSVARTFMREKRTCGWSMVFSPMVFYPMVLVYGFASRVLIPGIGSFVLDFYGFGPWFE